MIRRVSLIAAREFRTTITSKGFLIGLLIMPAIFAIAFVAGPRIVNSRSPQIRGDVAVVDVTGRVAPQLRRALAPAAAADPQAPLLRLIDRPADADITKEKSWLVQPPDETPRHLALIVVHPNAVERAPGAPAYGSYDLYVSSTLDTGTEGVLYERVRQSLVSARIEASNLDRAAIDATMSVARPQSIIVAAGGERQSRRSFNRALPFVMGILLFVAIMSGGQMLMTSTVEEKSSRVVEVLLAAVSPIELMAGKLLGQLGIGLVTLAVYVSLGLLGLQRMAMLSLLDPVLVPYLVIFFLQSYLLFGALMSAIGAAVDQMADAQSLMGPVMMLLMAPYVLTPMIGRAPNSAFSVAVSFIPPLNSFGMMARLASDSPPPGWQVALTIVIGMAAAAAAIWFSAKIFKVGLLMHGKPPNFATLVRWARMA